MAKQEEEEPPPLPPPPSGRLLRRLALVLIRHADLVCLLSCIAGFIALLLLPALAKQTYISENALIPGSASPKFSTQDADDVNKVAREILSLKNNNNHGMMVVQNYLVEHLADMGADFYLHPFSHIQPAFSAARFFSTSQFTGNPLDFHEEPMNEESKREGINVVGIIRAPRGDGKEAIVLVTPFDTAKLGDGDAVLLGLGFKLFCLLSDAQWLAKDIIWVAADAGDYDARGSVTAWLKDYHDPAFLHQNSFDKELYMRATNSSVAQGDITVTDFKRAGVIAAGLVLTITRVGARTGIETVKVHAEGPNGQMPNLDLINVVNTIAVWRQGLNTLLDSADTMLTWRPLKLVGWMIEKVGGLLALFNPSLKFGLPISEYINGAATLTTSIFYQATGIPTGAHGAFRDYQLDAVTLVMSPIFGLNGIDFNSGSIRKYGRLLEGVVRSVNNLLEKFHQSFFLYFLSGPGKFISVGVYMIPLSLLLVTLPLKAATLFSNSAGQEVRPALWPDALFLDPTTKFGKWMMAVLTTMVIELWSLFVSMAPLVIHRLVETSTHREVLWLACMSSSFLLVLLFLSTLGSYLGVSDGGWVALKASTLGAATIGLGIMSAINFATALVGAVLLVPMCLVVRPIRSFTKKGQGYFLPTLLTIVFTIPCSLPAFVLLSQVSPVGQSGISMLWDWTEKMWYWGSATYLYVFLVHLPCSIMCLLILFDRKVQVK